MEKKDLGKTSTGIEANVAALLSYLLGFITGIIFYLIEKENKFVRFHAMQSIITFGSLFILSLVLVIMFRFMFYIGYTIATLLWIAQIILWALLMFKAYQGELFKLPIAGNIADKYK